MAERTCEEAVDAFRAKNRARLATGPVGQRTVLPPPKKKRPKSRVQRWHDAVSEAQAHLEDLKSALQNLYDVQQEYTEWRDNLPENLQQSALGEKLNAVADLDLDSDQLVSEAEGTLAEAESLDLPLGFGRD